MASQEGHEEVVRLLLQSGAQDLPNKVGVLGIYIKSVAIILLQVQKIIHWMNMDVGMHHAKNRGNKEISLAILSKILAQSCVTLPELYVGRGYAAHDCASIFDSIAKEISLFPRFFAWCIPSSIFIQWMIFALVPHIFLGSRRYAHAYMRSAAPLSRVSLVKWRQSSSHTLGSWSSQLLLLLHILRWFCEKALHMGERSSLVNEPW